MGSLRRAVGAGFTRNCEFSVHVLRVRIIPRRILLSKYRDRLEIIADILKTASDGARKTQIMYRGNLSYKLLMRYLREVIGSGLVCAAEKANIYELTEKGKMFLKNYELYSRSRTEAEQQLSDVKSLKTKLEGMCTVRGGRKAVDSEYGKVLHAT
jgi:predicted transcriptional regulator